MSDKKNLESISALLLDGKPEKAIDKLEECFPANADVRDIVTDYRTNYNEWLNGVKTDGDYNVHKTKIRNRLNAFIDSFRKSLHNFVWVFSNPKNKGQINFQDELNLLQKALSTPGPFKIDSQPTIVPAVTKDEFFDVIQKEKPRLLLLSMHGDRDKGFYFLDAKGEEDMMSPERLINDIKAAIDFTKIPLECIVLNCCNSATHARELSAMVPFAIGMDGLIYNHAAELFVYGFYKNLIQTGNYDDSFKAGVYEISRDEKYKEMAIVPQKFSKP